MRFLLHLTLIFFFIATHPVEASNEQKKHLLLTHPTQGTIEILYSLQKNGLIDFGAMQLTGVYHKDETYDYNKSILILDTISCFKIELLELTNTLFQDSLYCNNACSKDFISLFENSDGIIFFGGPDIPPAIYNEEPHHRTKVTDPYRHYFEASFLFHLLGGYQNQDYTALLEQNPDYLILGICLGMQTMNVATGGTLIQDIPSEIYKSNEKKGLAHLQPDEIHRNFHPFTGNRNLAGSWFHKIRLKDYYFIDLLEIETILTPTINSYHHQAVEHLGKGFKVGAVSMDEKIIEAIFHIHYPNVLGVQFHPERSQLYIQSKKYQFEPQGPKMTMDQWIDEESMEFHLKLWKAIDEMINEKL